MKFWRVLILVLLGPWSIAAAQDASSPVGDLLTRARESYDGLRYAEADSLARQVLTLTRVTQRQQTLALQIAAASRFPEEEGSPRFADSALVPLRQLVRINFETPLPRDLSWAGLDSLFGVARKSTFAMKARHQTEIALTGPEGDATLEVASTRDARFRLTLTPGGGGSALWADSAGPSSRTSLHLRGMRGIQPILQSGDYELAVTGVDAVTADSVTIFYKAVVDAPALELVQVPTAIQAGQLLPERSKPARKKGIVLGVLVGGVTVGAATVLRGPEPIKSGVSADNRAYLIAGGLLLGAVAGALLDHGEALPKNFAHNIEVRAQFEKSVGDAKTENERRIRNYRAILTLSEESR